ncbi:uncharacterized protein EI97DRAFT_4817 [Westerdykella ornata]|uniref:Uncharacterized protein n=1 Tax=Westerdykella ornata TaxID=318751 RepID=A0A6A6JX72_WESOR|nr:uncharacterized protein EI97DRAFT_4817 [Westerdykella ornata]KAF2280663.1 hypothetical protein EI97DRAFT_4817 [Westerdykella ornata]
MWTAGWGLDVEDARCKAYIGWEVSTLLYTPSLSPPQACVGEALGSSHSSVEVKSTVPSHVTMVLEARARGMKGILESWNLFILRTQFRTVSKFSARPSSLLSTVYPGYRVLFRLYGYGFAEAAQRPNTTFEVDGERRKRIKSFTTALPISKPPRPHSPWSHRSPLPPLGCCKLKSFPVTTSLCEGPHLPLSPHRPIDLWEFGVDRHSCRCICPSCP